MYKRPKIIKVEEPPKKDRTRWSLWKLIKLDYGDGICPVTPAYMTEDEYKLLIKEEELIKKGYDIKELEEYADLIIMVNNRNQER